MNVLLSHALFSGADSQGVDHCWR